MRDPWFPIALMLVVLIGVWLGVLGPMPAGFTAWLQQWQTLVAVGVASIAAFITFRNTSRTLEHNESLERNRRIRKHAAVRAVLPLALAQVSEYAKRSAQALVELLAKCEGQTLPAMTAPENLAEPLPSETLKALTEFIEYSDGLNVRVLEGTISWIQIHNSRVSSIVQDNRDPSGGRIVVRTNLEGGILDAASIHAGAAVFFDYSRGRAANIPTVLSWASVENALRNLRFWDEQYPSLFALLRHRATVSSGPFERLNIE